MKEPALIRSVHHHLVHPDMWAWKINDPYNAGIPDCHYAGDRADRWAEYKILNRASIPKAIRPDLSDQQIARLRTLYRLGKKVNVVVGVRLERETVLFVFNSPSEWESATPTEHLERKSVKDWAAEILSFCCNSTSKGCGET